MTSAITAEDEIIEALAEAADNIDGPFRHFDLGPLTDGDSWRLLETVVDGLLAGGHIRRLDLRDGERFVRTDRPCMVEEPTLTVYFLYDANDDLLYVGVTSRPVAERLRAHAKTQPWWGSVERCCERQVGWERARDYERECIITMQPRHNVVHSNGRVKPRRALVVVA